MSKSAQSVQVELKSRTLSRVSVGLAIAGLSFVAAGVVLGINNKNVEEISEAVISQESLKNPEAFEEKVVSAPMRELEETENGCCELNIESLITDIAGNSEYECPLAGDLALDAPMRSLYEMETYGDNLYFTMILCNRIYELDQTTGVIDVVGGNGEHYLGSYLEPDFFEVTEGELAVDVPMDISSFAFGLGGDIYYVHSGHLRKIDAITRRVENVAYVDFSNSNLAFNEDKSILYATNFYTIGNQIIYSIDIETNAVDEFAGGGTTVGPYTEGLPATSVNLNYVYGPVPVATDGDGNVYFTAEDFLYRANASGVVTKVYDLGETYLTKEIYVCGNYIYLGGETHFLKINQETEVISDMTRPGEEFSPNIIGLTCDGEGNLYVGNYLYSTVLGRRNPEIYKYHCDDCSDNSPAFLTGRYYTSSDGVVNAIYNDPETEAGNVRFIRYHNEAPSCTSEFLNNPSWIAEEIEVTADHRESVEFDVSDVDPRELFYRIVVEDSCGNVRCY